MRFFQLNKRMLANNRGSITVCEDGLFEWKRRNMSTFSWLDNNNVLLVHVISPMIYIKIYQNTFDTNVLSCQWSIILSLCFIMTGMFWADIKINLRIISLSVGKVSETHVFAKKKGGPYKTILPCWGWNNILPYCKSYINGIGFMYM